MKIIIAGGTGFIGKALVKRLQSENHELYLLSRSSHSMPGLKVLLWDAKSIGSWAEAINGADAVINLTGESIAAKRWSTTQKNKIITSRLDAANVLFEAIRQAKQKPKVLINSSAVGFYGNVPEGEVTESTSRGKGFLADTCAAWETSGSKAKSLGIRVVLLRIGVVLEWGGGALEKMILPFKLFAGGPLGSGKQWFPWVHRDDVVGIILFALRNEKISGPINVTAPEPLRISEFCKELGKVLHRPSWAPVPAFVLKIILGEMSELLLEGQKVVPEKVLKAGYSFRYPAIGSALTSILKRG